MSRAQLLLVVLIVAMAAVSARAAMIVVSVAQQRAAPPAPPKGYDAGDHFPGAALLYASDLSLPTAATDASLAAPASGTTGTAPLPTLPIPSTYVASPTLDGTIHPARPFVMTRASGSDYGRALNCLATAIYYEAASEPDAGQRAVAQVILNRVRHPAFPGTVCGVVYQGSEKAGCQFSYACDGAMARVPSRSGWARALHNAGLMLAGTVEGQVGTATHYHTYAVTPRWNRQMVMTAVIGAHFFHRWQGYWGTPASLSVPYRGGEPLPGPHARLTPLVPPVTIASTAGIAPPAATPASAIQPAYVDRSVARAPAPARTDNLPDSQILDKWKDSGKPLR
ncbi:MAG: cell wall hydrolase [Sphingomonas sp.]|uniref:cell wall hydrolase n=1 Tax=Sphingomonas sp. TaxID=28214 RepID=UPI0025E78E1D|nr:cell wall hydrolase [Sphingomonas sp.]MBY0284486.1 cell wall hydrolase [Sphingomonas sp.]